MLVVNVAPDVSICSKDRMKRARFESPFSPSASRAQALKWRPALLGVTTFATSVKR